MQKIKGVWKLVWDKIPARYERSEGRKPRVRIAHGRARQLAFARKMVEESREFARVLREGRPPALERQRLIEELADHREAERAFCRQFGISISEISAAQRQKRKERGGFDRGIIMFCD